MRSRQQTRAMRPRGQRIGMKEDLYCTRMGFLIMRTGLRSSLKPNLTQDGYSVSTQRNN